MPFTLCLPPWNGEECLAVKMPITEPTVTLELPSRHLVTGVESDADNVWLCATIANPEFSRPVYIRVDTVPAADEGPQSVYTQLCGKVTRGNEEIAVYGTYIGLVSDEN